MTMISSWQRGKRRRRPLKRSLNGDPTFLKIMANESPEVISVSRCSIRFTTPCRRRGGTKRRVVVNAGSLLFFPPLALSVNKNAGTAAQLQRESAVA